MSKLVVGLAGIVLGVGLMVSAARVVAAAPVCGHGPCGDEVAQCGLSGKARSACFKTAIAACKASHAAGGCTCADPGCFTCTGGSACVFASPSGAFLE